MAARSASRRVVSIAALTAATALALAGCGGDGETGAAKPVAGVDGKALLDRAMIESTIDGKEISSGRGSLKVAGSFLDPDDRERSGKGSLTVRLALSPQAKGEELPEFSASVALEGSGGGSAAEQLDYEGGVSHVGGQLYAQWAGKDYAFGEALTAEAIKGAKDEIDKQVKADPSLKATSSQLVEVMDLEAGSWVKAVAVAEGGSVEGADTYRLSGELDPRAASRDLIDGMRKLADAFPGMADADELRELKQISDADLKDVEKALKKAELVVWAGKADGVTRRMLVDVAADGTELEESGTLDFTFDLRTGYFNQRQPMEAPAKAEPVTDLILLLEQEFGGLLEDFGAAAPVRS